jgi:hypothetical protein
MLATAQMWDKVLAVTRVQAQVSACVLLPVAQAQEGLIVALEDADLLLLDGNVYSRILTTGRCMQQGKADCLSQGLWGLQLWPPLLAGDSG